MSRIVYKIFGDENKALIVSDMGSQDSMQVPNWHLFDEEVKEWILEVIKNIDDDQDCIDSDVSPIEYLNEKIHAFLGESSIENVRRELGVKFLDDGSLVIEGEVFPERFAELLKPFDNIEDAKAVVAFAKKLNKNPFPHTKEALIEWVIANPEISFTRDGDVVGYRGLQNNFHSFHKGYGIVNGVEYQKSTLENKPGNVIEFPVSMTDMNPSNTCSYGLHVGTWGYAKSFSRNVRVSVRFSPEHVISPPSDATQHKIRVSKMEILERVHAPYNGGIIESNNKENDNNE